MIWHKSKTNSLNSTKNGLFFSIEANADNGATLSIMHSVATAKMDCPDIEAAKKHAEDLTSRQIKVVTHHGFIKGKGRVYFLSTDHCQESRVPDKFVPVSTYLPYLIAPQPGFETGIIDTKEKLTSFLKHCGQREIPNPDPRYQPLP